MRVKIGIENGVENLSLAWALDYPGCFAYGMDDTEAIIKIPEAILRYKEWVDSHEENSWLKDLQDFDIHLEDSYSVFTVDDEYNLAREGTEINAWFRTDWKPLTEEDIRRGRLVLQWSRNDLLELVASLDLDQMSIKLEGERWTITGILRHVANAEHWYLSRMEMITIPREELPDDPFERLLLVREQMESALSLMPGMLTVRGVQGEFWSARKILRRAAWHEIDHIEHIFKLLAKL